MAQMTPVSIKISNHKSTIKTLEMIDEKKEAIQRAPTAKDQSPHRAEWNPVQVQRDKI